MKKFEEFIKELVLKDFNRPAKVEYDSDKTLQKLIDVGTKQWLDTGQLEKAKPLWKKQFTALTTNNTLVNQVIQQGIFDDLIPKVSSEISSFKKDISQDELITEIGFILNCRVAMRLVENFNCLVSVELHPKFGQDIEKSVYYGTRYYNVLPTNFIVKVPLTPEGFIIARKLSKNNIPVNFTLGFSARQNYLAGAISNPAYVNVFMGRLNSVISDNKLGDGNYAGEKATMATQVCLNELKKKYKDIKTLLIGASIRSGQQMADLAGIDVFTCPPKAVEEFYKLNLKPEDIKNQLGRKFEVKFNDSSIEKKYGFDALWNISDEFKKVIDDLRKENLDDYDGKKLVNFLSKKDESNILYEFSEQDLAEIKKDGKIPKLDKWVERKAPLDYLMTVSAIKSFETDQEALDNRIKEKI